MKKIFVPEDLNEFARRGRPRKKKAEDVVPDMEDTWYQPDEEMSGDIGEPDSIEDVDVEDETVDFALLNKFKRMIDNELKLPEVDRGVADFKLKSTGEKISGIPLAKLSGGESVLFKTPKGMKKVKINDILFESLKEKEVKYVPESINEYFKED